MRIEQEKEVFKNKRPNTRIFIAISLLLILFGAGIASALVEGTVTGFTVSPNPIRIGSTTYVQFNLSEASLVTAKVFNESDQLVATLSDNQSKNAGGNYLKWYGKAADGSLLPDGNYKFTLEAKAADGTVNGYAEVSQLAAQVPSIGGVSHSPSQINPIAGEQLTVNYILSNPAKVTVKILFGSYPVRTIEADVLKEAGGNTVVWDGKKDDGTLAGDGTYTYQIDAVSPYVSSFKSTYKASDTVTVEKEAPRLTDYMVYPSPLEIGAKSLSIRYALSERSNVTIKVLDEAGNVVKTILNGATREAGYRSESWDGKIDTTNYLPEGKYSVVISAVDNFDKTSGEQSVPLTAANKPVISGAAANPGTFDPDSGGQSTISYILSHDALVTVKIFNGSYPVRNIVNKAGQLAGANTVVWDGKDDSGAIAGDGIYTFEIWAESKLVSYYYNKFTGLVTIEKGAPQVTDLVLAPNPFKLGTTSPLDIRYNLSEAASVTIDISRDGNLVKNLLVNVVQAAGYQKVIWDGKDTNSSFVPEGNYTVTVKAVDSSGIASAPAEGTVAAAYEPAISDVSLTKEPYNPADGPETINFSLSNDAVVTVTILKDGKYPTKTISFANPLLAGANKADWDGTDSNNQVVADGSYTYRIEAKSPTVDYFRSTREGTITVEKNPPQITDVILSPNPYKLGTTSPLDVRYNLSETASVSVEVYKGSTFIKNLVKQSQPSGYQKVTWDGKDKDGKLVGEGEYKVVINATDTAGLKATPAEGTVTAAYQPTITNPSHEPTGAYDPSIGEATINFTLSNDAVVTVTFLKADKYPVRTINCETLTAGINSVKWNGKDDSSNNVPDGSYTYQIEAKSPTVDYYTSTYKGALTVETGKPEITNLVVSPYTVKIGENASFRYALNEPASVSFTVYGADGSKVRRFPAQVAQADGYFTLNWDTKDGSGNFVSTGEYTIKALATDNSGSTGATELAFKAAKVPEIINVKAEPAILDTGLGEKTSTISYEVTEESQVTIQVFDSNNKLFRTLAANKVMDGTDSVVLDVYQNGEPVQGILTYKINAASVIGYFKAIEATGTIQVDDATPVTPPPSGGETGCLSCHSNYPSVHPVSNCFGCHGNDVPVLDCRKCHQGWTHGSEVLVSYECEYCHNATYSDKVPGHGDITNLHTAPLATDCQKCHEVPLDKEHPLHTDDTTGYPYDCNTCHQSTVADVVYAIDNGQKNCDACHGQADHEAQHTPTGIETDCTKCHIDSLTTEHLNNPKTQTDSATGELKPWTCDTCHSSTASQPVQDAITNNQRNCDACHASADHQTVHNTSSLDVNCTTASGCHNNNLTEEHMNNPVTQTDPATGELKGWTCDTCHASEKPVVNAAVYAGNENCMACHSSGHNVNFVAPVPDDIPKYPGFIWTAPQNASLWSGESWMPMEYTTGGKVVISNRRPATNGVVDSVYGAVNDYYVTKMQESGWNLVTPESTRTDYFALDFTKGERMTRVWFYGGADHSEESAPLGTGYRIELIYK